MWKIAFNFQLKLEVLKFPLAILAYGFKFQVWPAFGLLTPKFRAETVNHEGIVFIKNHEGIVSWTA